MPFHKYERWSYSDRTHRSDSLMFTQLCYCYGCNCHRYGFGRGPRLRQSSPFVAVCFCFHSAVDVSNDAPTHDDNSGRMGWRHGRGGVAVVESDGCALSGTVSAASCTAPSVRPVLPLCPRPPTDFRRPLTHTHNSADMSFLYNWVFDVLRSQHTCVHMSTTHTDTGSVGRWLLDLSASPSIQLSSGRMAVAAPLDDSAGWTGPAMRHASPTAGQAPWRRWDRWLGRWWRSSLALCSPLTLCCADCHCCACLVSSIRAAISVCSTRRPTSCSSVWIMPERPRCCTCCAMTRSNHTRQPIVIALMVALHASLHWSDH